MTRKEAKTVFLNRGYVEVEGGTIYDPDKWREACRVISEWLEQQPCEVEAAKLQQAYNKGFEDCRKAVLDAFRYWFTSAGFEEDRWWNSTHVLAAIEGLPPVAPKPYLPDTNIGNMAEIPTGSNVARLQERSEE